MCPPPVRVHGASPGDGAAQVVTALYGGWRVTLSGADTSAGDGGAGLFVNVEWVARTPTSPPFSTPAVPIEKLFFRPPIRPLAIGGATKRKREDDLRLGHDDAREQRPHKASRPADDDASWCDLHQVNHSLVDDCDHSSASGGRRGDKSRLTFDNLPTEVQCEIFLRLPMHEVMATLPLVCSQWREMAYDETLWHSLHSLCFGGPKTKPEATWRKECGIILRQLQRRKKGCEEHLEAERSNFKRIEFLWAIKRGHLQLVRGMLDSPVFNIDVNQRDRHTDEPPLIEAARSGNLEIVQYLLDRGAHVDAVDRDACSALTHACIRNQPEVVRLLLSVGADANRVSKKTCTPLMYATSHSNSELTKVLLDAGVSLAEKDRDGFCSLLYAVTNQNKVAARLILQSGADVNTTSSRGWTCLMHAAGCGDEEMFDMLVQHGAKIDAAFEDGRTPLFFAASHGHHSLVKKLVVAGAEVNHRDEDGWTPLHSAAEAGAHEVVRLLLAHGADPALETYDTDTPLAFAANAETARLLRRALGEPDDQSDDVDA